MHQFHLAAARGQKRDDRLLRFHFFEVRHVQPQRITPALTRILKRYHPLWMSLHFTHPDELTPEVAEAITAEAPSRDHVVALASGVASLTFDYTDGTALTLSLEHGERYLAVFGGGTGREDLLQEAVRKVLVREHRDLVRARVVLVLEPRPQLAARAGRARSR